jgi:hypothetical protein
MAVMVKSAVSQEMWRNVILISSVGSVMASRPLAVSRVNNSKGVVRCVLILMNLLVYC